MSVDEYNECLVNAGSARAGSRQNSESGDPIQSVMDEAVEAAKAAAAAVVTNATESHNMDIEAAAVSPAGLPGHDNSDSQLWGSDGQLRSSANQVRGSSPDAAVPMNELPLEPVRGTPVRVVDPSRAVTPPPRSTTPPPSHPPSLGPADGIRYNTVRQQLHHMSGSVCNDAFCNRQNIQVGRLLTDLFL